jgi:two-component system sensor histidine kinase RegB
MTAMTATPAAASPAETGPGQLRLRTLVRLRWLAVTGQTAAVLVVQYLFGFPLPIGFCFAAIALSAWLNIFLSIRWRHSVRLMAGHAALLLGYDVVQLAVLLYLTGGLENPFAFLFLVPVTISATSLPLRWTAALGALALFCASFLAFRHLPLPWRAGETFAMPGVYVGGMWAAIICGVVFSAIYARRIAEEARQMQAALAATEMVLARAQRLSALDGLAAAAAHELGTPLATIALVAKELKREMPRSGPHAEDVDLLVSQADRCRLILARLANVGAEGDEVYENTKFAAMIEDLVAPQRGAGVEIAVDLAGLDASPEPVFRRNPAIAYGLGNLLENALDFARSRVELQGRWSAGQVSLVVRDDGPGFDPQIFDRLGEPYVTSRPGYGEPAGPEGSHEGMGLGFFIAKTLLERSGASVTLANRQASGRGASITIQWPRTAIAAVTDG